MNTAYANVAVDRANAFFNIQEDNNIAVKGAKAVGRAFTQTAITLGALAETFFSAILTVLAAPLYFFSSERFAAVQNHTKDAATATLHAAKSIAGYTGKKAEKVEEAPAPAPAPVKPTTGKVTKVALAAALVGALGAAGYFYGPSAVRYASSFFASAANKVSNPFEQICISKTMSHFSEKIFA